MIKGWRLDPRWVEYRERIQDLRNQRYLDRLTTAAQVDSALRYAEHLLGETDGHNRPGAVKWLRG